MVEKLAGLYYWADIAVLILAGIMIAMPFALLLIVKILDGIDTLKAKIRRRKKGCK